jgi:hypothetical protein
MQCSKKFGFPCKSRVYLPMFNQANREKLKKTGFPIEGVRQYRGFLFNLQTNQPEGSFLLDDDLSSGSLLVLLLWVLTILVQNLSRLVQIGLLPPALLIKAGGSFDMKHRGDPRGRFESLPPPLTLQQGIGIVECQTPIDIELRVSRTYTSNVPPTPCLR